MKSMCSALFFLLLVPTGCSIAERARDFEKRVTTVASQRIDIQGVSGSDVTFKSWEKNEIYVKLTVRISASDEKIEEDYINGFEVEESASADHVTIRFRESKRGSGEGWSIWKLFKGSYMRKEIVGEIYVPNGNALTTDLSYGSITLNDMKGEINLHGKTNELSLKDCRALKTIENDYGTTVVENSGGELTLSGVSSKITIEKFDGPVAIDAKYSTIVLKGLTRTASVHSQSGKVTADQIGGNLTIRSDYTTISVANVKGIAEVHSQSGSVRVEQVDGLVIDAPYTTIEARAVSGKASGKVSVRGMSGSVTLEDIQGDVTLDCPYSKLSLEKIRGSVDLTTQSGRVTANDIAGDWKSKTDYSTVRIRGLKAKSLTMRNKSNPIDVEFLTVPMIVSIVNEYGSVEVSVPKGFSGDIQLDSENASIETDFPIRVKKTGGSAYATGKVGSGSGSITIETKSGNITLSEKN